MEKNQINRGCFPLVTCEERFKDAEKFTFNETFLDGNIRKLMNTYYNWGELLAFAPYAISGLERLIVMSHQRLDFPIGRNDKATSGLHHIKDPESFRTTLLQIGHQGYLALLNAHINIDKIRNYNSKVSSHIKDAVRYLMSRNDFYIANLLSISMGRIKEAADRIKEYLQKVISELKTVIELIQETLLYVEVTKTINGNELERVELNLKSLSGRWKTRQNVERTSALNIAKRNYREVIKALQEGRQELENLKGDWT